MSGDRSFSAATIEKVVRPDGSRIVLKRPSPEGDWLTRVVGGVGNTRRLYESGLLHSVRPFVDHTILEVRAIDGQEIIVMRDATDALLGRPAQLPRDLGRAILGRLAALHEGCRMLPREDLCPISARYALFAPDFHAADAGPNPHPHRAQIAEGWELFEKHVDRDTREAVFSVHSNPRALGERLGRFEQTLLHGDLKLENLGLDECGLVAIDWGNLTGFGPKEIDIAWFAATSASRLGCSADQILAEYDELAVSPLDQEAIDLACVGSLAQMGFRFALGAHGVGRDRREIAESRLKWWTNRAREALDRLGTV